MVVCVCNRRAGARDKRIPGLLTSEPRQMDRSRFSERPCLKSTVESYRGRQPPLTASLHLLVHTPTGTWTASTYMHQQYSCSVELGESSVLSEACSGAHSFCGMGGDSCLHFSSDYVRALHLEILRRVWLGSMFPACMLLFVSCPYLSFLGFSPEPTSVELHVDGVSDICTKGGDINFVFTGFSVNGKVWLQALSAVLYIALLCAASCHHYRSGALVPLGHPQ